VVRTVAAALGVVATLTTRSSSGALHAVRIKT